MGLLLPEAADSRWIDPARIDEASAQDVLLRMRLYVLIRILFGQRIFINEGWSLDSVSFHKVAAEVISAINLAKDDFSGALSLSPFRVEARSGATVADRLLAYLRRGECQWSGMPQLQDRDREQALLAKLDEAPIRSLDTLAEAMKDAGINPEHVGWFGRVASYLDDRGYASDRLAPGTVFRQGHYAGLRPRLAAALDHVPDTTLAVGITHFMATCDPQSDALQSSSSVEHVARSELDPETLALVTHLSRTHYMLSTSEGQGVSVAGPTCTVGADLADIDGIIDGCAPPTLEFAGPLDFKHPIARSLADEHEWGRLWREVISLTQRKEWREAVAQVREDYGHVISRPNIVNTRSFDRLESLLEKHCPSLV